MAQVLEFFRVNRRAAQRKKRAAIQRRVINKIAENKADEVRYLAVRYRPHSLVAKVILEAGLRCRSRCRHRKRNWNGC